MNQERLHRRYLQQATWTRQARQRLLGSAGRGPWLEIGAGTGAIARELAAQAGAAPLLALDIRLDLCRFGIRSVPQARWYAADAHHLPLPAGVCAAAFFHFVLLWLDDPASSLVEAARVVQSRGVVVALAEPDHAARIDHPADLERLGALQTHALSDQGANVRLGRQLGSLFHNAGLIETEIGVLGGSWSACSDPELDDLEWDMLGEDLRGRLRLEELDQLRDRDQAARARGERVLFVPTFYAIGRVP